MTQPTLLYIDDDSQSDIFTLLSADYKVTLATTGQEGMQLAATTQPDLILMDIKLAKSEGAAMIASLREWTQTPILVYSNNDDINDKLSAFSLGANDYILKSCHPKELMARLKSALRISQQLQKSTPVLKIGQLEVDLLQRKAALKGDPISLSHKEYNLLKVLAIHHGKVVTQNQLLKEVWGNEYQSELQYLRVYIGQLRKKLKPRKNSPHFIHTVSGVGYRLEHG
ncbi:response regulator transcription factor [Piscirickettsia litoralis]|uniref:DNA-binding response regulator n=1 Tax=Piscirickettsia litoralis TaxID=1891921 RepID=A0ABX3A2X3_9GAMM|nr:response regulator transcription factor [Piscirickettsia litoralis]ODN43226.1 DNA-binding response regulator [Piscirickettsia litoralis]